MSRIVMYENIVILYLNLIDFSIEDVALMSDFRNIEFDPLGLKIRERERERELGSFENSYIPENPRTSLSSYISQTVIPFKKPTSGPSKTFIIIIIH
ncbi:hypothetical protein LXL04_014318 [Taraxacum kok-saghyz]